MIDELRPGKGRSRVGNSLHMLDMFGGKLKKNYVLPDFLHIMKGYIKGDTDPPTKEEQVITFHFYHLLNLIASKIDINNGNGKVRCPRIII